MPQQQNSKVRLVAAYTPKEFNEELDKFITKVNVKVINYHLPRPVAVGETIAYVAFVEYVELA